jgi:hypothetical protein
VLVWVTILRINILLVALLIFREAFCVSCWFCKLSVLRIYLFLTFNYFSLQLSRIKAFVHYKISFSWIKHRLTHLSRIEKIITRVYRLVSIHLITCSHVKGRISLSHLWQLLNGLESARIQNRLVSRLGRLRLKRQSVRLYSTFFFLE